jgi:hypothetical protein
VGSEQGSAFRLPMPADATAASTLGNKLGFGATPVEVDEEWLNLFPLGDPLEADSYGIDDEGQPVPYADTRADLSQFRIGDLLQSSTGTYYLLGDEKPQRLSDFAGMVYDVVGSPVAQVEDDLFADFGDPTYPAEWPATPPSAVPDGAMCAVLHPQDGAEAAVSLATNPTGAADPAGADPIRPGRHDVDVAPSAGAYVLSGSEDSTEGGTAYVIDTKGEKYGLGPQVPEFIGYADVQPALVPSTWLTFFQPGVSLTTNSARRVPEDAAPADAEADAGS